MNGWGHSKAYRYGPNHSKTGFLASLDHFIYTFFIFLHIKQSRLATIQNPDHFGTDEYLAEIIQNRDIFIQISNGWASNPIQNPDHLQPNLFLIS